MCGEAPGAATASSGELVSVNRAILCKSHCVSCTMLQALIWGCYLFLVQLADCRKENSWHILAHVALIDLNFEKTLMAHKEEGYIGIQNLFECAGGTSYSV